MNCHLRQQPNKEVIMNIQLVKKSSNKKIGKIPCTTSSKKTCPNNCPMKDGACYAESGYYTRINWDKVTDGIRGGDYKQFLEAVKLLRDGQLWRHNVAGDLQPDSNDKEKISSKKLRELVNANKGKKGFTYTHYKDSKENIEAIRHANENGFTINLSANNLQHAIKLHKQHNLPVATLAPINHGKKTRLIEGVKFITCPATYKDEVTCDSCRICQKSDRDFIVAFPAHGSRKNQANIIARG